ncbi:hypothetical protein [Mesorhizobium sp.]|uniref:hypothetical protein n=1 Tax=Mesorhizobium sp. TaxID=1871066 RepID=UPI0025B9C528|nr:hypothetical protein [Mesorhizobium sp.]
MGLGDAPITSANAPINADVALALRALSATALALFFAPSMFPETHQHASWRSLFADARSLGTL